MSAPSVAIIGLGRVGLPLSLVLAATGCEVRGIDINTEMLSSLAEGRMPFSENDADELLASQLGKSFRAGNDISAAAGCDYIVLTLGTPVDHNMDPDLSQIETSIGNLAPHLSPGQTIILRSTVNPGTTAWVQAKLEDEFGFRVGQDIFLAFCPERIAEGRALKELHEIPQIVGGIEPGSTQRATVSSRRWRAWSARSRSVSLREATVISQPRGWSGRPPAGHCAAAAISASWVASSASSKCP